MDYGIILDKRNPLDVVQKLAKQLEEIPILKLEYLGAYESSLVSSKTGEEIYPIWILDMHSNSSDFMVCWALKRMGLEECPKDLGYDHLFAR